MNPYTEKQQVLIQAIKEVYFENLVSSTDTYNTLLLVMSPDQARINVDNWTKLKNMKRAN